MATVAVTPLQKRQKEGLSGTIIPLRLDAPFTRVFIFEEHPAPYADYHVWLSHHRRYKCQGAH